MKKYFILLLVSLFTYPIIAGNNLNPESQEATQTGKPAWINALDFINRQSNSYSASGEMYFPEDATVTVLLAAPINAASYDYFGYWLSPGGSYGVNSSMGDQYIVINMKKGQTLRVEARRNGISGSPARVAVVEVNGYEHRPYPVVH